MTTEASRAHGSTEAVPSVLTRMGATGTGEPEHAPGCFHDLKLDQVVAAITAGREAYDLRPLFQAPLRDPADVAYRHEVFRDLADAGLRDRVEAFSDAMRGWREHARRAAAIRNPLQHRRLVLDGASTYCRAVAAIADALERHIPASRGLRAVAAYLAAYVRAPGFRALRDDVERLERDLGAVAYRLTILEDRVRVRRATTREDYGEAVERTFRRFRRGDEREHRPDGRDRIDMNHVEAAILELVARLHPEAFGALEAFAARHEAYLDPVVARFEREVQFYLAYLAHARRFAPMGLGFCLPEIVSGKRVHATDAFDLALAGRLLGEGGAMVCNDVRLDGSERILVVTGANQGGKSTFARMFGQLHYLAALGCPVPGSAARLPLFDELLTHFEREEDVRTLHGKLQDELVRLSELQRRATRRSVVILNEPFASTAPDDALELGRETLRRLLDTDVLGVYVTFVDELSTLDERVASVTATVDPHDAVRRTFEIVRRPADGRAHALGIARAYGLTYDELRRRLRP